MSKSDDSGRNPLRYKVMEYDYSPDDTIFREDPEKVHLIKNIIFHRLPTADRVLLLMYAELGNIRAVASLFHVSRNAIHQQIKRIRATIKNELKNIDHETTD